MRLNEHILRFRLAATKFEGVDRKDVKQRVQLFRHVRRLFQLLAGLGLPQNPHMADGGLVDLILIAEQVVHRLTRHLWLGRNFEIVGYTQHQRYRGQNPFVAGCRYE